MSAVQLREKHEEEDKEFYVVITKLTILTVQSVCKCSKI